MLKQAKIKASQITAIGLSGQMHGSVFLGDGPKALRPALLWNDQRTVDQCRQIQELGRWRELKQRNGALPSAAAGGTLSTPQAEVA